VSIGSAGVPSTIAEVGKLFAAGAGSVTLTRAEWEAKQTVSKGYEANRTEVYNVQREAERQAHLEARVARL
jgi:hypothetical protein